MLHYETIHPDTLELLRKIQSLEMFKDARLVGGTALSLQLGHRKSIDLDFFGSVDISLQRIASELSTFASVSPLSESRMMCFLIVDGVKVDIVNYPYPWIDEAVIEDGVILAGIKDIAAMKLSAITNRGTRKDFVDFYYLLKYFHFEDLINFYVQKYSDAQLFTTLKSLTYFDDAEQDPMPAMITTLEWEDVKSLIVAEVGGFLK